jgi:hypothetical protein
MSYAGPERRRMENAEPRLVCQEKFKVFDKHLEDAPSHRDEIVEHREQIKTLFVNVEKITGTIRNSAATIILTIALSALALAVTWGKTLEKVERLDRAYQKQIER